MQTPYNTTEIICGQRQKFTATVTTAITTAIEHRGGFNVNRLTQSKKRSRNAKTFRISL